MVGAEKISIDDRFHVLKKMFSIAGTPLVADNKSLWYRVYKPLLVVSGYLTLLTTFIGILKNLDNMDYVMEAARPGFVMINLLWMHFFISMKMDGVRRLLNMTKSFTWSDLPCRVTETGSLSMAGWIQRIQPLMWKANFCDWGAHLLYFILRGVANSDKPLFFNAWSPFDMDSIPLYIFVLIIQGLGSVMQGTTLFAVMGLYVGLVAVACTQLQKIQAALQNVRRGEETNLHARLAQCVAHHQLVVRYMRELENTFSMVLLGPFLSVVAALCFTAYTAITVMPFIVSSLLRCRIGCEPPPKLDPKDMWSFVIGGSAMHCGLSTGFMMYFVVYLQSGRVKDAVWNCEWVGAPVSFQRSLVFMLSVTKDFKLTAGKIIPVYQRTVMAVR
ncbi:hypothetical protein ANN_03100 [Periplaneta americana]|uniref:Odorant receptor n=1 Tax=Periplaneta americana TaxID=6978 RepID=A0ABQ8TY33_PERAM|nr:hypothetical protein ANN_03100 [Periplaneta americana]